MFGAMSQTRRESKINILRERIALEDQALQSSLMTDEIVRKKLRTIRFLRSELADLEGTE